eukprot:gene35822-48165_t
MNDRLRDNPEPLRLSLDLPIQAVVREELSRAMESFSAIGGAGIVMDVRNACRISTRGYTEFFNDTAMLDAAWMSIRVGVVSATLATVLGTLAAIALARGAGFRGRALMSGMLYAPLVMPEVITGISMLMLFILMGQWIGWPGKRGFTTVTIAHITFSMTYVATIIQSRLSSMDGSIEEAALDLGSKPWQVLKDVTLPIIAPAIMSGWLLAFTISLDDVVIAQFVSGPGSTTLPMEIFSKVRLGVSPDINALATIIIGIVAIGVGIATVLQLRRPKAIEAQISSLARFGDRIVPPMRLDRGITRDYVFYRWAGRNSPPAVMAATPSPRAPSSGAWSEKVVAGFSVRPRDHSKTEGSADWVRSPSRRYSPDERERVLSLAGLRLLLERPAGRDPVRNP